MTFSKNIKNNCMQATIVCILLLIGGVKMAEKVSGFKEDGCKKEVVSKEEFDETKATIKNITIGTETPTRRK